MPAAAKAGTTVRDDAFVLEVECATRRAAHNPFSPAAGAWLMGTPREHSRGCPAGSAHRASRGTTVATLIAAVFLGQTPPLMALPAAVLLLAGLAAVGFVARRRS